MEYLIGAFAVFWILSVVQTYVVAPAWAWFVVRTVLSVGAVLLIQPSDWYWGIGVAGISLLIQRIEELLLIWCDRVRADVLRNRR